MKQIKVIALALILSAFAISGIAIISVFLNNSYEETLLRYILFNLCYIKAKEWVEGKG
ncbi:hypothetical protein [Niallia sp. FSL M8-0099]|jgi:hypothetical protein|uniref:hypothetical protein n=1 Tax=Niallia sp. FSL M8-0099 TaxID=2954519 RepID=UPI001642834F